MTAAQIKEILALMMIGEGVVGMLYPEQYSRVWETGPRPWRDIVNWCAERPDLIRLACAVEASAGLWLATRQFPAAEATPQLFDTERAAVL